MTGKPDVMPDCGTNFRLTDKPFTGVDGWAVVSSYRDMQRAGQFELAIVPMHSLSKSCTV